MLAVIMWIRVYRITWKGFIGFCRQARCCLIRFSVLIFSFSPFVLKQPFSFLITTPLPFWDLWAWEEVAPSLHSS